MNDEDVMNFLMHVASYVAQLHERNRLAGTTATASSGPVWESKISAFGRDSIPAEEENFARWMGWRGQDEQERELRNVRGSQKSK